MIFCTCILYCSTKNILKIHVLKNTGTLMMYISYVMMFAVFFLAIKWFSIFTANVWVWITRFSNCCTENCVIVCSSANRQRTMPLVITSPISAYRLRLRRGPRISLTGRLSNLCGSLNHYGHYHLLHCTISDQLVSRHYNKNSHLPIIYYCGTLHDISFCQSTIIISNFD